LAVLESPRCKESRFPDPVLAFRYFVSSLAACFAKCVMIMSEPARFTEWRVSSTSGSAGMTGLLGETTTKEGKRQRQNLNPIRVPQEKGKEKT